MPEHDAILTSKCPNQPARTIMGEWTFPSPPPSPRKRKLPHLNRTPAAPEDVYHEDWAAVEEAGAAPGHRGGHGYGEYLDGDGGSACEWGSSYLRSRYVERLSRFSIWSNAADSSFFARQ